MALGFLQADWLRPAKLNNLAVHPNTNEPFAFCFLDDVAKFPGLILNQGCQQNDPGLGRKPQDLIYDLLRSLPEHRFSGGRVVRLPDGREKDSQIIVNLSGSDDCRPRVGPSTTLLDSDGR